MLYKRYRSKIVDLSKITKEAYYVTATGLEPRTT